MNSPSEARRKGLKALADRFGLSPEEIARVNLEDLLTPPDEAAQPSIEDVQEKNRDLSQRLAQFASPGRFRAAEAFPHPWPGGAREFNRPLKSPPGHSSQAVRSRSLRW